MALSKGVCNFIKFNLGITFSDFLTKKLGFELNNVRRPKLNIEASANFASNFLDGMSKLLNVPKDSDELDELRQCKNSPGFATSKGPLVVLYVYHTVFAQ
jgi:hypothetical protein